MAEIKNQERILEAIDQLRRRKARPDAERICNFLLRRFAIESKETLEDLERLVEEDIVVKVEYKGNISYRNAAKWSRYAVYTKTGTSLNSEGTSSLLSSAIAELIIQEPDYLDFGVPGAELEKYMLEKDNIRFTKRYLDIVMQRELHSGNIVRLENGNYSLADHPVPSAPSASSNSNNETVKMLKGESPSSSQQVSEEEDNVSRSQSLSPKTDSTGLYYDTKKESLSVSTEGFRDGGKRKRSKKVFFDPSDVHVPTRKRGRPLGSTNKNKSLNKAGICCVCSYRGQDKDDLVSCKDCTNKAHRSCAEGLRAGQWQCVRCKTCAACYETAEKGSLVTCRGCGDSYHMSCHNPKIPLEGDFLCAHCSPPPLPPPAAIPVPSKVWDEGEVDESIPDVSDWSVEKVSSYLEEQGFPVQAAVFRDHDIDGASLLLMNRNDVLIGLHLKLGPALKVYGQVKKLQLRQSDRSLLWP